MSEPSATAAAAARPAAQRGTLEVRGQALEHLVEAVVRLTPGTAARRSGGRLGLGRSYPRASVRLQGGYARVAVDVACVWPCRVAEIATHVRDQVLAEGTRLSGVDIRDVDVTAHVVSPDADVTSAGGAR